MLGRDARIGGRQYARRRIVYAGQLVERNVALPLVLVVGPADGQTAVARGADRNVARGVVANMPVDVGVNNVLSRCGQLREGFLELIPVLCRVYIEKRIVQRIVERPAQRDLARLARNEVGDERTMAREGDIDRHVGLSLDVNDFLAVLKRLPAFRRLARALIIHNFDI